MSLHRTTLALLALALFASGCAFVPKTNVRLEEARQARALLQAEPEMARLAPLEAKRAEEAFERAAEASDTLQDPALVDHLAYVAKQRAVIAAETARRVSAELALEGRLHQISGGRR